MSTSLAFKNILKNLCDNEYEFDEDKEMAELAHEFKLVRLGKKIRENTKIEKDYNPSTKPTHKKSKKGDKWEDEC